MREKERATASTLSRLPLDRLNKTSRKRERAIGGEKKNRTCTFHVNRIHVVQQSSIEHLCRLRRQRRGRFQPDRRCETNGNYSQARFAPEIRRRSRRGSNGIFGVACVLRLSSRVSYPYLGARGREAEDEGRGRRGRPFCLPRRRRREFRRRRVANFIGVQWCIARKWRG